MSWDLEPQVSQLTQVTWERPLAKFHCRVCVVADYFSQHPPIQLPKVLKAIYSYFKGKHVRPIEDGVEIQGILRVNSTIFMMEAIKQGRGIGFIPGFVCREAIEKGEVIEILEKFNKPFLTLYALYPARHFVPPKVIQCIRFFEQWFAQGYDKKAPN